MTREAMTPAQLRESMLDYLRSLDPGGPPSHDDFVVGRGLAEARRLVELRCPHAGRGCPRRDHVALIVATPHGPAWVTQALDADEHEASKLDPEAPGRTIASTTLVLEVLALPGGPELRWYCSRHGEGSVARAAMLDLSRQAHSRPLRRTIPNGTDGPR